MNQRQKENRKKWEEYYENIAKQQVQQTVYYSPEDVNDQEANRLIDLWKQGVILFARINFEITNSSEYDHKKRSKRR